MSNKKKNGIRLGLVTFLVIGILLAYTYLNPVVEQKDDSSWHIVFQGSLAEAAEGNPGTGAGGFLEIILLNKSTAPATDYAKNVSATFETWATTNMPGKTPYWNADNGRMEYATGKTFVFLVRCRFNKTQCWDGSKFIGANTRVNITVSGAVTIATATAGTRYESYNNTGKNYIWENFVWDNGGSGYSVTYGGSDITVVQIIIWAKY
jgi:hypothetical protein